MPMSNVYYTPMRRSRCFVFDRQMNLRDSDTSKPKRTVTPFMYVHLPIPSAHVGLSAMEKDITKLNKSFQNTNNIQ